MNQGLFLYIGYVLNYYFLTSSFYFLNFEVDIFLLRIMEELDDYELD